MLLAMSSHAKTKQDRVLGALWIDTATTIYTYMPLSDLARSHAGKGFISPAFSDPSKARLTEMSCPTRPQTVSHVGHCHGKPKGNSNSVVMVEEAEVAAMMSSSRQQ